MIADERETVVIVNDGSDNVSIWTCRRQEITSLSKKLTAVESGTYDDGTAWARYSIPRVRYDVARGIRTTRTLTESQRQALSERARGAGFRAKEAKSAEGVGQ